MRTARRSAWVKAALVAAVVVVIDQITKGMVRSSLALGERRDLLGPIDLVSARNKGVAFGALSGRGWLVPVMTICAVCAVLAWFATRSDDSEAWIPSGLVLGGAVGNLFDRFRMGEVTDFIKLPHWPAFNVADMAITAGVILLVIVAEREAKHD
jgi:signal peptidase II